MKSTLKILFLDFWDQFDNNNNLIIDALKDYYNLQILNGNNTQNPDVIFYSNFGISNILYKDIIRIYVTGERDCPDFNLCDYAIGLVDLTFSNRYYRFNIFHMYEDQITQIKKDLIFSYPIPTNRESFCCVVSNIERNPIFFDFYQNLSKYKKIYSGGRWNNNIGESIKNKFLFLNQHKFNICFENELIPGYVTEKIYHAFLCDTIPIYWGDEFVNKEFKDMEFININNYKDINEAIEIIKEIDNNDNLYLSMINKNRETNLPTLDKEINNLGSFLFQSIQRGKTINLNRGIEKKMFSYLEAIYQLQNSPTYKLFRKCKQFFTKL